MKNKLRATFESSQVRRTWQVPMFLCPSSIRMTCWSSGWRQPTLGRDDTGKYMMLWGALFPWYQQWLFKIKHDNIPHVGPWWEEAESTGCQVGSFRRSVFYLSMPMVFLGANVPKLSTTGMLDRKLGQAAAASRKHIFRAAGDSRNCLQS